jgi:hypothetical protein
MRYLIAKLPTLKLPGCLLLFIACWCTTYGQVQVKGTVVRASNGKPLPGASVYFEHTLTGTTTDSAGSFTLPVPVQNKEAQRLVVSYIGYQTHVENITATGAPLVLSVVLKEKSTALQEVVVTAETKNGWRKWGQLFTDLFIGTSAQARHCTLLNKEALRFVYSQKTNTLQVYAREPLVIENASLGYSIRIDMDAFTYNFNNKYLFYEIHSFYRQLQAEAAGDRRKWNRNRLEVYTGSPMHFFRTLFDSSYAKQGFEVHRLLTANRYEWDRISALYQPYTNKAVNTSVADFEKGLPHDSLTYYHKIMEQGPPAETVDPHPMHLYEFATVTDSFTTLLHFNGRLSVTYTGGPMPREYFVAIGAMAPPGQPTRQTSQELLKPVSVLALTEGIPVAVFRNGAVKNDDLLVDGYFAWWNKMATSLPLDYEPPPAKETPAR